VQLDRYVKFNEWLVTFNVIKCEVIQLDGGASIKNIRQEGSGKRMEAYEVLVGTGFSAKAYAHSGEWTDYYLAVDLSFVTLNTAACIC